MTAMKVSQCYFLYKRLMLFFETNVQKVQKICSIQNNKKNFDEALRKF